MAIQFDPDLLSKLRSWEGLEELANADDPYKRAVAVFFGTPLLEKRLSELGIIGWNPGQVSSLHKAVRAAEERFRLDSSVVAAGLRAIKDRNKVAHHDQRIQESSATITNTSTDAIDDEESPDPIELILDRAPQVVKQLWALDRKIEIASAELVARKRALAEAQRRHQEEAERMAAEERARREQEEADARRAAVEQENRKIEWERRQEARRIEEEEAFRSPEAIRERARRQEIRDGFDRMEAARKAEEAKDRRAEGRRAWRAAVVVVLLIAAPVTTVFVGAEKGRELAFATIRSVSRVGGNDSTPELDDRLTYDTLAVFRDRGLDPLTEMLRTVGFKPDGGVLAGLVNRFALLTLRDEVTKRQAIGVILTRRKYGSGIVGVAAAARSILGKSVDRLTSGERLYLANETLKSGVAEQK